MRFDRLIAVAYGMWLVILPALIGFQDLSNLYPVTVAASVYSDRADADLIYATERTVVNQVYFGGYSIVENVYSPAMIANTVGFTPSPLEEKVAEISGEPKPVGIIPVLLEAPTIKMKSEIVNVGLLEDGQMEAPAEFDKTGWFSPGVKPGEIGNAAMAGHVDSYKGPAIFFYLKRLKVGDPIYVTDEEGKTLTFAVTSVESFKTEDAPIERIFGAADKPQLNLITCSGVYNRKTTEHSHRLVVFSELVEDNDAKDVESG